MESKKVFTKAMLQEECGIVEVNDFTFTRDVYKQKAKKKVVTVTSPSIRFDLTKDKQVARYMNAIVSLYNYKTGKYVNISFHKLRWIWEYGECPMGVEIDHIDTNPLNNKLDNLRIGSSSDNQSNRKCWKPFLLEEVKGKTVEEVCKMIAQIIEEYKDNPYNEQVKKEKKELKAKEREEWLSKADERLQERKRKTRVTTLKRQIKRLYENIDYLYESKHSMDFIISRVSDIRTKIKKLESELAKTEKESCII